MAAPLSAFGAKRTCMGVWLALCQSQLTQLGHWPDRNPALQRSLATGGYAIVGVGSTGRPPQRIPVRFPCIGKVSHEPIVRTYPSFIAGPL